MRFTEISPHLIEDVESKRTRLDRLFNERASLRRKVMETHDKLSEQKLARLEHLIASLEESMSPLAAKKAKLDQLKRDLEDLPQNPGSQAGYDALDDIRAEISDLETEISQLSENVGRSVRNDPTMALEQAHQRAMTAMQQVHAGIDALVSDAQRNSRDWGYPGSMAHVATQLEELASFLNSK